MDKKKNKKEIIYLSGKKIYLRPFLRKDITKAYLRWINNYEKNSFIEAGKFPVSEKDLDIYYEIHNRSRDSFFFAICNKKNKHIGNAVINNIDWVNRRCNYGRLIGDSINATRGSGTECLKILQDFVFMKLNLNLMWTAVCSKNYPSIKSNLRAGMKISGKLDQFFYRDNKYFQVTFFSITKKIYLQNKA